MFHNAFISFRCHPKAVHAYLFRTSISRKRCFAWTEVLKLDPLVSFDLGLCSLAQVSCPPPSLRGLDRNHEFYCCVSL